ncbi:MAG: BrnT family toxin [Chloroflexia bacterium]|nr:BrnT family toxin [Chloroflexia bacterium]
MADYLGIKALFWDAWNREHIGKHDVTTEEAEEAVFSEAVVTPTYKDRFQIIGPTLSGRVLSVIVGQVPGEPGRYYVFSARPASREERRKLPH